MLHSSSACPNECSGTVLGGDATDWTGEGGVGDEGGGVRVGVGGGESACLVSAVVVAAFVGRTLRKEEEGEKNDGTEEEIGSPTRK